MRAKYFLQLLLLFALAGCGAPVELPPVPESGTILAFGDSLTEGYGAAPDQSYPFVLASLSGRRVINAGVSGEVSAEGLARLPGLLDRHRPALLILCHGGNDLLRKLPRDEAEANLRGMIALARERAVPVLLLGVPRPAVFLRADTMYEDIADEFGLAFIPELVSDVLSEPTLKSDSVHPNGMGYSRMAYGIYSSLEEFGAL